MSRHYYERSSTAAHPRRRTGRIAMAAVAVFAAAALVLGMAYRPVAYAVGNAVNGAARTTMGQFTLANDLVAGELTGAGSATVLVYLNGSDLESQAGEATADLAEMLDSGAGSNVNIVVETLGTREWQRYGIASDHTQRYLVKQGKLELVDNTLGQLDTTSPDTLSDFISWGTSNYPADRYMLVMWDHGAGPVYGFGYDEFQSDNSALTLDEMQQALAENSNVHFDFIGMDCCIMSSLETCYALQPYCDYTILSEDFEPGIGWSYKGWLGTLEKNPGISTKELGTAIVDDMIKDVASNEMNGDATLALIDESAIDELYAAWVDFAYASEDQLLGTNYSQETEWRVRPGQQVDDSDRVPSGHPGGGSGQPGSGSDQYGMQNGGGSNGYGNSGSNGSNGGPGSSGSNGSNGGYGGLDSWGGSGGYGDSGNSGGFGGFDDFGPMGDSFGSDMWDYWDFDGSYVTMTDYFITDISEVASSVQSDEASALSAATDNAIVHFGATSGEVGMGGLGVTLPYGDAEFYDELVKVFTACGIDKNYVSWLEAFVGAEGVDNYYDFGSSSDLEGLFEELIFGDSYGNSNGYGYGNGYNYGDSYGNGYGNGYDEGYGNGYGYGDSYGNGYGNGYGYDDSYGYEEDSDSYGNGYEYGNGNGYGNGYGDSYGNGSGSGGYGDSYSYNYGGGSGGYGNGYGSSSLSHSFA